MLYDLATLRNLSNNDEDFILDMLQTFKRTSPPVMLRMKEYLDGNKYEAVGREAHKLIPGVSFLGAKELQEVLVRIEESAKNAIDHEIMHSMVTDAVQKVNELITCFEKDFPGKV